MRPEETTPTTRARLPELGLQQLKAELEPVGVQSNREFEGQVLLVPLTN